MVCEDPIKTGPRKGMSATGSQAGYLRHKRAGEPPCDDCRSGQSEYDRQYRLTNGARKRSQERAWYRANRQRKLEQHRRWRANNPERVKELMDSWLARNPDRAREIDRLSTQRRRARMRNALMIPYTADQVRDRMEMWGNRCWIQLHCDGATYEEVDHVIPLVAGGPDCLSNLRPACKSCNSAKAGNWEGVFAIAG